MSGAGFDPTTLSFAYQPSLFLQNQPTQLKFMMPDFEKMSGAGSGGVETPVNA